MSECNAALALIRVEDLKPGDGMAIYHIPGTKHFDCVWERAVVTQAELKTRPHLLGIFNRENIDEARRAIGKALMGEL